MPQVKKGQARSAARGDARKRPPPPPKDKPTQHRDTLAGTGMEQEPTR